MTNKTKRRIALGFTLPVWIIIIPATFVGDAIIYVLEGKNPEVGLELWRKIREIIVGS